MDWFNPQVPWNSRTRCDVRENLKKSTLEPLKYPSNLSIVASAKNGTWIPSGFVPIYFCKNDAGWVRPICWERHFPNPTARYLREETLRLYSLIQAGRSVVNGGSCYDWWRLRFSQDPPLEADGITPSVFFVGAYCIPKMVHIFHVGRLNHAPKNH